MSDGSIRCWGSNVAWGELGLPERRIYVKPTSLDALAKVKSIAAGWPHTCALLLDGRVRCWGANVNGDLGCPSPSTDVSDTCYPFPADSGIVSLIAGSETSCTRADGDRMFCWGRGDWGEIGDGFTQHRFSPTAVRGLSDVVAMGAGIWHTCAIQSAGAAQCWGNNAKGCLGIGRVELMFPEPSPVSGIDAVSGRAGAVVASVENTCFLMSDNSVRCAGSNNHGQLGDGSNADSPVPVKTQPPMLASAITLGTEFACALLSPQSVKCWGRGDYGTLGNGGFGDSATPVPVNLPIGVEAVSIAAKYNHVCLLDKLGRIWCWGDNTYGQLGNGTQQTSNVPVEVMAP